ncbi:ADP-ribosyltransferase [Vibrio phage vB_VmeM-32]|nr:ADP-ribosyltransferase [Vibrio phage vB_VmeM-32]
MKNVLIKSDFNDYFMMPKYYEPLLGLSIDDIAQQSWSESEFGRLQKCLGVLFKREQTQKQAIYNQMRNTMDISFSIFNKELCEYASLQSEKINKFLYDSKTANSLLLTDIISKIDKIFENTNYTTGSLSLYRGMTLPDYVLVDAMRDMKFTNKGYSSFSLSRMIANKFSSSRYCPLISNNSDSIDEFTNMADKISIFVIVNNNRCATVPMFENTNIPSECEFLVDRDAIYDIVSYTNQFVDGKLVAQTWYVNLR